MTRKSASSVSRRRVLTTAVLTAGAAAGAVAAPRVSRAHSEVFRMQSIWPAQQIFHEMAHEYVERVERMSGGRLKIDLRPADAVVPAMQVHHACHDGRLDAAHAVTTILDWHHKAAGLFGSGPTFGGDSTMMLAWMHRGGGQELYHELLHDILGLNLVGFHALPMPTQPFGWFRKPAETPGDLEGLRYRTVALSVDLVRRMGMVVARMWGHEVKPAMEGGLLDAFELNNPTFDRRFGAQEVAAHYVMASFHQTSEFLEIVFNKHRYESLPDELQAILRYAAEAAATANYATALDTYSRDLQGLIDEDGVKVSRTPESILDRQLETWDELMAEESADPFFAKVLQSQKAWCERVAFYHLMNTPDYGRAYRHSFPGRLQSARL
jgi:TRAP-type mannitol/chloroaromatic compound transport system substrate-binding protein